MHPNLTPGIDVALLVLWAFVLFFITLVVYLRREDRREGYPLEHELDGRLESPGGVLLTATPKTFILPFGHGTVTTQQGEREPVQIAARRVENFAGAPYTPTGNPLADGVGPAAWANRARRPDLDFEGHPRLVPLSKADGFTIDRADPTLLGWPVVGADGQVAGKVADLWIDKADRLVRYLQLDAEGGVLLAPMMMASVDKRRRRVVIDALTAAQFAGVPRLESDTQVTLYEEERVAAYFGGGYLYATPDRQEPFL